MKKKVMTPLGIPMPIKQAKEIDKILCNLPSECQMKRKAAIAETEFAEGERADISIISTNDLDRDGEILIPEGIDRTQYERNPVVLWAHDYNHVPVGRCLWIKQVERSLKAKTLYADRPVKHEGEWFPDVCFSLVQQQVLKGKSVGYLELAKRRPSEQEKKDFPELEQATWIVERALLLEYSVVPVPCNQAAIVEAVAKGLALSDEWLKRLGLEKVTPAAKRKADPREITELVLRRLKSMNAEAIIERSLAKMLDRYKI